MDTRQIATEMHQASRPAAMEAGQQSAVTCPVPLSFDLQRRSKFSHQPVLKEPFQDAGLQWRAWEAEAYWP
jgi:hypothetical protein